MKQERFAHEYLKDLNAKEAAIRAGYTVRRAKETGCDLLKSPHVIKIITEAAAARNAKCDVDATYVLMQSKEMLERCMGGKPILDSEGNKTGEEYQFDSSGVGKALKLLGEHVAVNAFKGVDQSGNPIDNNWIVTFVDATPNNTKKS